MRFCCGGSSGSISEVRTSKNNYRVGFRVEIIMVFTFSRHVKKNILNSMSTQTESHSYSRCTNGGSIRKKQSSKMLLGKKNELFYQGRFLLLLCAITMIILTQISSLEY